MLGEQYGASSSSTHYRTHNNGFTSNEAPLNHQTTLRHRFNSRSRQLRSKSSRTEACIEATPEKEVKPTSQVRKVIDPYKILPLHLSVKGGTERPNQVLYKRIFPWKLTQLRLAMQYGDEIVGMMNDSSNIDGQAYKQATEQLSLLNDEAMQLDLLIPEAMRMYKKHIPSLQMLTDPSRAPHQLSSRFNYPTQEWARMSASHLVHSAHFLHLIVE